VELFQKAKDNERGTKAPSGALFLS